MKKLGLIFIAYIIICSSGLAQQAKPTENREKKDSTIIYQDSIRILSKTLLLEAQASKLYKDSLISLQDSITKLKIMPHQANITPVKKIIGSMFGESMKLGNADSLINEFDSRPSFGIFRDNYIVVGTEMFKKATKYNSDAKFQVSIRQRLTNSVLPFKTHLYLTYTQKAFWDIFQDSFPFRDLNFNPGIGLGKPLIANNRFLGMVTLEVEHESNGKDGDASRSWNKITFGSMLTFNDKWALQAKAWIPLVDGENNKHLTSYSGLGLIALNYMSSKSKYNANIVVTKRAGAFFDSNILVNFSIRLFSDDNQYLFAEYYNGFGESMLDYKQYRQRIRFGIVIRPNFFSVF